jgi:hypothetical protein
MVDDMMHDDAQNKNTNKSIRGISWAVTLVEEADSDSSDESCSSDALFEALMEVLGSPSVPCGSAVVTRGGRIDVELA